MSPQIFNKLVLSLPLGDLLRHIVVTLPIKRIGLLNGRILNAKRSQNIDLRRLYDPVDGLLIDLILLRISQVTLQGFALFRYGWNSAAHVLIDGAEEHGIAAWLQ